MSITFAPYFALYRLFSFIGTPLWQLIHLILVKIPSFGGHKV